MQFAAKQQGKKGTPSQLRMNAILPDQGQHNAKRNTIDSKALQSVNYKNMGIYSREPPESRRALHKTSKNNESHINSFESHFDLSSLGKVSRCMRKTPQLQKGRKSKMRLKSNLKRYLLRKAHFML